VSKVEPYPAALALLARRPYSVAEMGRTLERKFPGSEAAREVVARLRAQGYLDDRKTAEQLASSLARNRRFGRHRVRRELKSRLFDYRFIEPALERAFEETDERASLELLLERKLRALKLPLSRQKLASLCRTLLRQGFASGDIIKTIRSRPELTAVADEVDFSGLETKGSENVQ
jgi:regulatory protein